MRLWPYRTMMVSPRKSCRVSIVAGLRVATMGYSMNMVLLMRELVGLTRVII